MARRWWNWALLVALLAVGSAAGRAEEEPAWAGAHLAGPMTAAETKSFARELAQYVFDHHLKRTPESAQRGMVYEYFCVPRQGQVDQFPEGEGLDTMHDGAWLAAAMAIAWRATGDPFYKSFLVQWQLPFYLKMLNHSDELFTIRRNDARPTAMPWDKPWAFQEGEKGFVPYFWDDGGSVSIDRRQDKNPLGIRPCVDHLAGKPNSNFLLDGYSQGSSNHMAQDLGAMLQAAWLLLHASDDPADRKLAAEVAEAANNLYASRVRHYGDIPMCVAPAALASGDAKLLARLPAADSPQLWTPRGHYVKALYDFKPDERVDLPGFADDQEYHYYAGLVRAGGQIPAPLAFQTIYDAYTAPMLYRYWSDDASVPAGVNRFDLHPYACRGGKLVDYRSDRKGPGRGPKPWGSRMGPQNMACCGWALQMLRAWPEVWEQRYREQFSADLRVYLDDPLPTGRRFPAPPAEVELGQVRLEIVGTRSALVLSGKLPADKLTVRLFAGPDRQGSSAVLTVEPGGQASAVNGAGEPLVLESPIAPSPAAAAAGFKVVLPYTVVKGQRAWANGIEHGRYSIEAGGAVRNLYLASSREQVEGHLEHELGAGLRTWQAVFRSKGYIPTGVGAGFIWDNLSDTGGYAHLIHAAAQWLWCLQGRCDWQQQWAKRDAPRLSRAGTDASAVDTAAVDRRFDPFAGKDAMDGRVGR